MTRIFSITMAIIIMLTAGVNTEMIAAAKPTQTITASVKAKSSPHTNKKKKKKKHKHYMPKGNMVRLQPLPMGDKGSNKNCRTVKICRRSKPTTNFGNRWSKKWFKTKKALRRNVDKVMNEYNRQYEDGEITWDEYVRDCPYGYEAWSCSCGKWTGNFKYSKVKYININHYIKYAKSYAKEIGLGYDANATDCWDNPITVTTTNKKYIERDIKARLDRYKNIEDFEGICVWAKTDGGDQYQLYIGYY